MQKYLSVLLLFFVQILFAQNYSQYVNPFIGTGGHGHTFPGATLPFGMVQLSPDTRIDSSWDGCSGYHYSDSIIYGFSHTHLSGTGVSDYGDIMLMPTMGVHSFQPEDYASKFSHDKEKASAGYYSVHLGKYDIDVELTASMRVGFHKYTFNQNGEANIILDLNHRDKLLYGEIKIENDSTISVLRESNAWASNQKVWAKIEFNKPVDIIRSNAISGINGFLCGETVAAIFSKQVQKGEELLVKVSLSFTGFEGAELNSSEIPHWDFDKVKSDAEKAWNKELSKIEVKSNDKDKLTIFYTALYHTMIQPNIAQDLNGKFMGRDFKVHEFKGFDYYTVFSLWDTFRAYHPLMTLINQKRTADFINTFITQYEQGGRLPVWELASNETDCMIGYHSVSVMADAMMKGIQGFDYEKAFEAARHSAMLDIFGLDAYKKNGFISIDDEHESVSKTLEYAYDDWCIAQMALILGKNEDYQYFMQRSQNWKNLFDPETHLMRPKKNGTWLTPFDGREVNNNYTEGNSWQYSFFVPQDIYGLIEFHGGKENFEQKLDELFALPSETTGRHQVDITGLIGQYAQGNEPSHHVAYLYNYVGKPEKTKEKVHFILDNFYKNSPDGLIGNEDCGQMSAWYVLSSMGIYSVTPGSIFWTTTEPYFDEIKINFEDGTSEIIKKPDYNPNESKTFRNKPITSILPGKYMGPDEPIIPVPYFEYENRSFSDEMRVEIKSLNPRDTIFYRYEYPNPTRREPIGWMKYEKPLNISSSIWVLAYIQNGKKYSKSVSAHFYKRPNNYSIQIHSKVHPLYTAGGPEALLDGIKGTENWRKGDWQGYQGTDFEAVIDLKKLTEIHLISVDFLQDARPWILMPKNMKVYSSTNGKNFQFLGEISSKTNPEDVNVQIETLDVEAKAKARYLKIIAENYGKLPASHISAGEPAYIFVDEITVE